MCRWMAYSGTPVLLKELLFRPVHSLIDQSLHAQQGAETTNGDGFGVGWYGVGDRPAVFRSVEPAWHDRNLRELAEQVSSGTVLAHIRASSGSPVEHSNCHPFRHGRWLWMHNGLIADFPTVKRDLVMAIDPELFPHLAGSTDSEVLFFLALTYGLEDDVPDAVERAVGLVEDVAGSHGIEAPVQMTVATTNGQALWAFRYASAGTPRSLYSSTNEETLRHMYPDNPVLHALSPQTRFIVSEPLGQLAGAWNEVPASSYVRVGAGDDELWSFRPQPPGSSPEPRVRHPLRPLA